MAMMWNDLQNVKKGNIGEQLVEAYLADMGFVVYKPVTEGSHPFDRMIFRKDKGIYIAEVKTKPARKWYPDTGFNLLHYQGYKYFYRNHNIDTWVFFVDEDKGEIYGGLLSVLEVDRIVKVNGFDKKYPSIEKPNGTDIIFFPLEAMQTYLTINQDDRTMILNLSQRKQEYAPE